MNWVLILIVASGTTDGGIATDHISFDSRATCENARAALRAEPTRSDDRFINYRMSLTAVCVPDTK